MPTFLSPLVCFAPIYDALHAYLLVAITMTCYYKYLRHAIPVSSIMHLCLGFVIALFNSVVSKIQIYVIPLRIQSIFSLYLTTYLSGDSIVLKL